jgi:hypothetical protein
MLLILDITIYTPVSLASASWRMTLIAPPSNRQDTLMASTAVSQATRTPSNAVTALAAINSHLPVSSASVST